MAASPTISVKSRFPVFRTIKYSRVANSQADGGFTVESSDIRGIVRGSIPYVSTFNSRLDHKRAKDKENSR